MTYGANFKVGENLPASIHCVSVSMPEFQNVIDYEENKQELIQKLKAGYPRFVFNPEVQKLHNRILNEHGKNSELVICFPSLLTAKRCSEFVKSRTGLASRILELEHITALFIHESAYSEAKAYWQHFGEITSSRLALHLNNKLPNLQTSQAKELLKERLAKLYQTNADNIYLYPSGMAAFANARRAIDTVSNRKKALQFGFPYIDNLKLLEKTGEGALFLNYLGDKDLLKLQELLSKESFSAIFCEVPGNPLLRTPDLIKLHDIATTNKIPLIVDDTISGPLNTNCLEHADLITTSLTKYFSGAGDVMGGALILNPRSELHEILREGIEANYQDILWEEDAIVLEKNSRDFPERQKRVNDTTQILLEHFQKNDNIERIYHPLFENKDNYEKILISSGGYGGLFSLKLRGGIEKARKFYDRIYLAKGPTFGTNFTICCPYTLLAHYHELQWAENLGIPSELIRFSIGLEDPNELLTIFEESLNG
ncbi:MAG: PLP-dependent transferase [Proteobacteria bacterium]|nr:PLP-dependent transferase [Pseudomonadota bacterium]